MNNEIIRESRNRNWPLISVHSLLRISLPGRKGKYHVVSGRWLMLINPQRPLLSGFVVFEKVILIISCFWKPLKKDGLCSPHQCIYSPVHKWCSAGLLFMGSQWAFYGKHLGKFSLLAFSSITDYICFQWEWKPLADITAGLSSLATSVSCSKTQIRPMARRNTWGFGKLPT